MSENQELIKDFLLESYENLDRLDRDFVELEKKPDDRETISSIFRTIHTIKGTCGFLGFHKLESVSHVGESLLSRLREGELRLNSARTSGMLAMVDAVRQILNAIEGTGGEGTTDYSALIALLNELNQDGPATAGTMAAGNPAAEGGVASVEISDATIDAALSGEAPAAVAIDVGAATAEAATAPSTHFAQPGKVVVDGMEVTGKKLVVSAPVATDAAAPAADGEHVKATSVADQSIRVDVTLLDKLMNLVGELVLARNQVLQHTAGSENAALGATTQRLNLITTELQEGVMKTRMQPINMIWQKFPRVVRDLSAQCGKKIRLEMEGKETELDKTIIEAIKDPLTHIVRNSIDHGVETPAKRAEKGKSEEGCLSLRAFHEGGQVNIEIIDDGAGINPEKVKAKALEKGLITPEQAARMGEREATNLIFLPGFSTAEKITNVSGRGVGMDVVKTNIEKIGGTVDITSRPGNGTTLRIKIPLTLAIIPALLITSGGERFAIPQVSLLELVRLESGTAAKQIETVHGAPVYRLRGNLLPLTYLNHQLGLAAAPPEAAVNIVVLQADGRQFGLVVDDINDTEEIVVKPLGKQLKAISRFAGATIMGDGRVALILDVMGLAQAANVVGESREQRHGSGPDEALSAASGARTMLLLRVGSRRRMAVALADVARLEEFANEVIEQAGDSEVVQYRGRIMPLIRLSQLFPDIGTSYVAPPPEGAAVESSARVVVYASGEYNIGVVVDAILDIADEAFEIDVRKARSGVFGSAVIQGKVTEILDVKTIVGAAVNLEELSMPAIAA